MEEKNRENVNDEMMSSGAADGERAAAQTDAESGSKAGSGKWKKKIGLLTVVLILAGCAFGWYHWNLPEQRLARALKEADELLAAADYEEAASLYEKALEIDGDHYAAAEGYLKAKMTVAEEAAEKAGSDIAERTRAAGMFEEIIAFCDEKAGTAQTAGAGGTQEESAADALPDQDSAAERAQDQDLSAESAQGRNAQDGGASVDARLLEMIGEIRESAAEQRGQLLKEIAEDHDAVKCVTVKDDRSGRVVLSDGTEVPYSWYYDLVQIEDDHYPLADQINMVLARERDAFFSGEKTNPSVNISGRDAADGDYYDYVGVAGIYSGEGLLSIRMAEIRGAGHARAGFFRGKTFRLSDGKELTLADVTARTDSGIKHLVKKKIREWFEQEGYNSVSMTDVEAYIEETDPKDLKYCIHEDGRVYLAIDQEAPFFAAAEEILEIPLN